ncbi:hypothetical protein BC941DRAFT_443142 [Chlamydoabsidia padenii]|nr:hypothetical protein BC941DRAFT_443142 [Chlamydoabsidia padenii]
MWMNRISCCCLCLLIIWAIVPPSLNTQKKEKAKKNLNQLSKRFVNPHYQRTSYFTIASCLSSPCEFYNREVDQFRPRLNCSSSLVFAR